MKILKFVSALALGLMISATTFAGIPLNKFNGTFVNKDSKTRGITKLVFSVAGSKVKVRTFGSCTPTDCDWGTVKGTAYSSSISQKPSSNTEAIQVVYKKGHATTVLVVTPYGAGQIAVRSMTVFTDGSGRQSYSSLAYFKKKTVIGGISRKLPAPVKISPTCGKVFNHFPRKTNLRWKPVRGAVKYIVEIDCFHCCKSGKWCYDVGKGWKKTTVKGTSYSFNFVGAQPGRWRVTAVDKNGKRGKTGSWCKFRYTK